MAEGAAAAAGGRGAIEVDSHAVAGAAECGDGQGARRATGNAGGTESVGQEAGAARTHRSGAGERQDTALHACSSWKFLLSFFSFVAIYWALWGWKFGLGIAALVLIHEMGHFVDIKLRGLPAEMPVFLPLLGAYVGKWDGSRSVVADARPQ